MKYPFRLAGLAMVTAASLVGCGDLETTGAATASDDGAVPPVDGSVVTDTGARPDGGGDGGVVRDATPPPGDATPPPVDSSPPPPDAPTSCVPSGTITCFTVPGGWALIAYGTPPAACPSGFGTSPTDVSEGANVPANACACDGTCSVSTAPTCPDRGQIASNFDLNNQGTCTAGQVTLNNDKACCTDNPHVPFGSGIDANFIVPGPNGGACTPPAPTKHPERVTFAAQGRLCSPDSSTSGGCNANGVCSPSLPAPFLACVAKSGDHGCPGAPFTVKHHVETGVTFNCGGGCTCNLSSGKCTGTVTYFTDGACQSNALPQNGDGACHNMGANGASYGSYSYTPNAPTGVSCTTTGQASAPSGVSLVADETVCCAQ